MNRRVLRVNELLREELSQLLQQKARDPRLSHMVSITSVSVSKDLKHAKVYVSILGSREDKQEVLKGLEAATPFLRRNLGSCLSLRYVPDLVFYQDDSLERGARLLDLMNKAAEATANQEAPG